MQGATRIEKDLLGERALPADALWGIHTLRARENFPLAGRPVRAGLIHAYGAVKQACLRVNHRLGRIPDAVATAVEQACEEMTAGALDAHVIVDALQGGAGTSTNMNVNEVLANRALCILGVEPGAYDQVDPLAHVNLYQSTNDTYPTALKVAALRSIDVLEDELVALQEAFQVKEHDFADVVKVGRTQLMDACLCTLGREMGAYAEVIGRDRWRVAKCRERLRVVNLGGGAIGTASTQPRPYVFAVVDELKRVTGLALARADNLFECTQNADLFSEVSGILKAAAVDLIKIGNDLRLLGSGPEAGLGELLLPARQAGSSIMPGKVNPVIPEAVVQAGMQVIAGDLAITQACAAGCLELNPFLPLVADHLLNNLDLLAGACRTLREHCVVDLAVDRDRCAVQARSRTAVVSALVAGIGYEAAQDLAQRARAVRRDLRDQALADGTLTAAAFDALVAPAAVNRLGIPPVREGAP